ncbi:hypothetical protein GCM10010231_20680 [Streptomyces sindenensis]|nr:hypothetical protein GCM10010231_20680 [Streptomyces sindenensis]
MQTSTLVSPGSGSRGAGVPSCAYQNDMPPTTVLTVLMMPLVSLSGEMPSVRVAGRYCARGRFVFRALSGARKTLRPEARASLGSVG